MQKSKTLKQAIDFHGHLGPYLVLGMLMGGLAVKALKCRRHFGIKAIVKGATDRPKSCLIDGIQVSTGCTYGKGNIRKIKGNAIGVLFRNLENNKKVRVSLKGDLIASLDSLDGHKSSERFARELLGRRPAELFTVRF